MSIEFIGFDALIKNLAKYHQDRVKKIKTAVQISQAKVVDDARFAVPKRTRALMKSIQPGVVLIEVEKVEGEIHAGMEYANYIEFGTGARGAISTFDGKPEGLSYSSNWKGMYASPYLTPALRKNRTFFLKQVENAVRP